jgi:hypothetical protein
MQALSTFKNLFIFFILTILITCFGCNGGSGGDSSTEKQSWTIMVYMAADNDLSDYAEVDLQELEIGCNDNDNIKILVLIDQDSDGDTRLYKIKHDLYPWTIVSERLSDSTFLNISATGNDELDMSNPNTLSNFIKFCQANYPSENYALILWNHGGGWRNRMPASIKSNNIDSLKKYVTANKALPIYIKNKNTTPFKAVCWDDTTGFNESLTMSEVKQAVSGKGLTVIGFDACLMGMVEVAYQLKDCAQYMIASEETIPGFGWAYDYMLDKFYATSRSAVDFGKAVIDSYIQYYTEEYPTEGATLSLIDLSKVNAIATAIDQLSNSLINASDKNPITAARHKTLPFTVPHFIDAYHLAENLATYNGANALKDAISNAVVYHKYLDESGDYGFANSHGLSIYFPLSNNPLKGSYDEEYPDYNSLNIDFCNTQWNDFLKNYFSNVKYYTIETFGNGGGSGADTLIGLFYEFNNSLIYLDEDDDSGNYLYSKITFQLGSGIKYYVVCYGYNSG